MLDLLNFEHMYKFSYVCICFMFCERKDSIHIYTRSAINCFTSEGFVIVKSFEEADERAMRRDVMYTHTHARVQFDDRKHTKLEARVR